MYEVGRVKKNDCFCRRAGGSPLVKDAAEPAEDAGLMGLREKWRNLQIYGVLCACRWLVRGREFGGGVGLSKGIPVDFQGNLSAASIQGSFAKQNRRLDRPKGRASLL